MRLKSLLLAVVIFIAVGSFALGEVLSDSRTSMLGGWFQVATNDPGVKTAADHAIAAQTTATGEKLKLIAVQEARAQVVAGMNYQLILVVERNGKQTTSTALIWAKLDGSYQLTKWSWAN